MVSLSRIALSGLTVPSSTTIAANTQTATFTYNGTSQSMNLSLLGVTTVVTTLFSVQCDPSTMGSNASSDFTAILSGPAPAAGANVALSTALGGTQ